MSPTLVRNPAGAWCVAILAVCFIATGSRAQQDLTLELQLDKETYLIGEPFVAEVTLRSIGQSPVTMEDSFNLFGGLRLFYKHEGESSFHQWGPSMMPELWGIEKTITVTRQGVRYRFQFSHDVNRIFEVKNLRKLGRAVDAPFDLPGRYELQAVFARKGKSVSSNVVDVAVVPPEGIDADALSLWMDNELLYAVQEPDGMKDEVAAGTAKLQALVDRFGNTAYGKMAARALAREGQAAASQNPTEFDEGTTDIAAPAAATPKLRTARENSSGWQGLDRPYLIAAGAIIIALLGWAIAKMSSRQ